MGIFRKNSLERLSNPEDTDQLMKITGAREWIALAAMSLLLGAAGAWCYWGAVASTVAGQGAIVRRGGIRNVVTSGSGVLSQMDLHLGDHIHQNQIVAYLAQPATVQRLESALRALEEAQRDRLERMSLNTMQSRLQLGAIQKRDQNARQQIEHLREQIRLAEEQASIQEGLLQKGLVTRHQVVDAHQQVASLQTDLANRQAEINQFESDRFAWEKKPEGVDQEIRGKILDLQARVAELQKESQLEGQVVSPYEGEVIELKAYQGQRVDIQTAILSIQPSTDSLEVVAYVPSLRAKEIRPGMEVQLSPSIVKREEYGFLRGRVQDVGAFPATRAALMRNFENENLLAAFVSDVPVTELHLEMQVDPQTVSGFRWSSSKGPPIQLSSGMLCGVEIVTHRQRPLALILPFLRQQAGMN